MLQPVIYRRQSFWFQKLRRKREGWLVVQVAVILCASLSISQSALREATGVPLEGGVDPQRIQQVAAMLDDQPFCFGPKITDREAWKRMAATDEYARAISGAEKALEKPMAEMTERVYLQFKQTGKRTEEYRKVRSDRHGRVTRYTLAECLENRGRFLKPLEAVLHSICQEKTWVNNYHDGRLENYNGKTIAIDLGSADLAQNLGACLWVLGSRLSPEIRQEVLAKLHERIFDPYRQAVAGTGAPQKWITTDMNWNSVCHAGVVAAALAACSDRNERAFFAAAAEKYSQDFLRGFGGDGYCAEGMGYWNYGFGNYVQLCETVFQATKGGVDLYNLKGAREAALYPVRIRLLDGIYPAYADCSLNTPPSRQLMSFINRRYEFGLRDFATTDLAGGKGGLVGSLMNSSPTSAAARPVSAGKEFYEIRSWFEHGGVLNCRPLAGTGNRMAVSIKGGHNAEPHNHNDLGTFVVAVGQETLILDPGKEVYTARTFSKDRYQSKLLNSYGHPVPVVAGQLQQPGAAAKAVLVAKQFTDEADTCALDLRSAYPVPSLQTLTRTFHCSRAGTGALSVTDDFAFKQPEAFASALITYSQWKQISERELLIYGKKEAVKVEIESGGVPFKITSEVIEEDNGKKSKPTRIGINLAGSHKQGKVVFRITPSALN